MLPVSWLEETFILHPHRCMYWEKEKTLIISDLHLGKTGHFRKEGIAVPQQVFQQDLQRLFDTIHYFNPREILLTGDLFHSRSNLEWDWFARWRKELTTATITLVLGNHDKVPARVAEDLDMHVFEKVEKAGLMFVHNAHDVPNPEDQVKGIICGHVHPAVKVATGIRQSVRLPCFHFSGNICTMPAFSLFTGTHVIRPGKNDRLFALTGREIIPMNSP
ncbi:MAG: ligase-associated DNA damage response endonuclease PdeM [Chitinophagaceae bacterium]|nr:ligase-associated DNA damage response endonuclease PdeM [Chitinophagaceae bacterium]